MPYQVQNGISFFNIPYHSRPVHCNPEFSLKKVGIFHFSLAIFYTICYHTCVMDFLQIQRSVKEVQSWQNALFAKKLLTLVME